MSLDKDPLWLKRPIIIHRRLKFPIQSIFILFNHSAEGFGMDTNFLKENVGNVYFSKIIDTMMKKTILDYDCITFSTFRTDIHTL